MHRLMSILKLMGSLAFTLLAPWALAADSAPQRTVRITNGEWPPYLGEQLPNYGTTSDLISRAFTQVGYRVEYGFFPWTRSLTLVERKEWDASAVWRRTTEREQKFHLSDPVLTQRYSFFYRKDSPVKFGSFNDLNGKFIGIARSYHYGQEFKRRQDAKEFVPVETESDLLLLRNVAAKRLAAAPLHREVGLHLMKTQLSDAERDALAVSDFSFEEASLYLLFARTPEGLELTNKFNAGLRQVKKRP